MTVSTADVSGETALAQCACEIDRTVAKITVMRHLATVCNRDNAIGASVKVDAVIPCDNRTNETAHFESPFVVCVTVRT